MIHLYHSLATFYRSFIIDFITIVAAIIFSKWRILFDKMIIYSFSTDQTKDD